ncbi:receptor-like protein 2 [Olea europaea var. sylvestris]|uniref:receptor-like protein 2 n=1 Tax=Olea europaea var. sylvestris TaxID=158386 RepID=UPI000C1D0AB5|nr:receptor-like protein 2 [Olea europaea var. sylvestris]
MDIYNFVQDAQLQRLTCLLLLFNLQRFDASNNSFSGSIPSSVSRFSPSIVRLDFSKNDFVGPISHDFGQCHNLLRLRAGFNNLSGAIPNELTGMIPQDIGRLSNLEQSSSLKVNFLLLISPNSFSLDQLTSGIISSEATTIKPFLCKNLIAIRMATNSFNGKVLPEIMALQFLSFLSLPNNSPNNITNAMRILIGCKNLSTLILSKNFYNEPLPGDEDLIRTGEFQNLQVLGLGGCGFAGLIPIWLSRLDKLEVLDLSLNNITGSVPGWFGDLPNLFYLDLSQNLLSGNFTMELIKLRRLATQQTLDQVEQSYLELTVFVQPNNASNLQSNQLSNLPPAIYLRNNGINGTIPIEIGQLKFNVALDLSNNNFSGSIPDTIANLTNLEKLDLSSNNLSGQIPASLKNLHFLSLFMLSNNNLEGLMPVGGQFDIFSKSSFEGNPLLCGKIL